MAQGCSKNCINLIITGTTRRFHISQFLWRWNISYGRFHLKEKSYLKNQMFQKKRHNLFYKTKNSWWRSTSYSFHWYILYTRINLKIMLTWVDVECQIDYEQKIYEFHSLTSKALVVRFLWHHKRLARLDRRLRGFSTYMADLRFESVPN